ncbi:MAG: glycosyltransferase domain-containing protein, partial [Smithella sp.]
VHAPGLLHSMDKIIIHTLFNPYWIPIMKNWQKEAPETCRKETKDELTIITWNSTDIKGYCEQSLEKLGLDYLVLGKGMKTWQNINKITTALDIVDLIRTPYVMALDCFDVIVLRDPYEALEKFKAMGCEMLFNAEKNYYPDYGLAKTGEYSITDKWKEFEINVAKSEWGFLNSGAFIVKTSFYKEFLLKCLGYYAEIENKRMSLSLPKDPVYKKYPHYKISDSDQLVTHWLHHDYYPRIKIDYRMDIFFNTIFTTLNKRKLTIQDNMFTGHKSIKYETKVRIASFLLRLYLKTKNQRSCP